MNVFTKIKTKFVSLIAKLQNKTCCWFHSFTLFTGTAVQPYNIVACTVIWWYGNIGTCYVNHVIHMLATWLASMRQYCSDVSDVAV